MKSKKRVKRMDDLFEDTPSKNERDISRETGLNADMPPSNKRKRALTAVLAVSLAVICFVLGGFAVWFSLDKNLRALIKIKTAIDKHYYQTIDDETFYGTLIKSVNHELLDVYSGYMTADEYRANTSDMAGNHIGIGVMFSTTSEEGKPRMLAVRVMGNSPAEKAGMQAGDYLQAFGRTQTELTESEDFEQFSAFLETLAEGETFYVRVRSGSEDKILTMSRQVYVENYVFYRTSTESYVFCGEKADQLQENGRPLPFLDEDTAYVRLVQFAEDAEERFEEVMQLFKRQGKKHLVLDLRDNGGGYLETMQHIAGYFCKTASDRKPMALVADYGEKQERFYAKGNEYHKYFAEDSHIYVLADQGTASASECLLGCMLDYGAIDFSDICLVERNGVAKTYGKGIMQTTFLLGLRGDAIKLTTAKIRWPVSNRSIHDQGILPQDGAKTVPAQFYTDREIESAMAVLINGNE
jgi:carboxyl-terminal processing protease